MAQSRMQLPQELAALLGRTELPPIRITPSHEYALMDAGMAITGKDANHAAQDVQIVSGRYPEFTQGLGEFKFPGRGRKDVGTKVGNLAKVIEYIMLLPGTTAARVRVEASRLLVRFLGGDLTLIEDVKELRRVQEHLSEVDPTNWRRAFGAAVEEQASAALLQARERLELERILNQIEEQRRSAEEHRRAAEEHRQQRVLGTLQSLRDARLPVDDRLEIQTRDFLISASQGRHQETARPPRREICLQAFVRSQPDIAASDVQSLAQKLGRKCAQLARNRYGPDYVFERKTIYCNGQQMEVNCWWEDTHAQLVQDAWDELQQPPTQRPRTEAVRT